MWIYEKRLQFPVNIKETNAQLAQAIISQYGGPDGEMGASTLVSAALVAATAYITVVRTLRSMV